MKKMKLDLKINMGENNIHCIHNIFHKYDIRGIYPSQINEETVYKIAKAFVFFTKSKKILVARDKRKSSDSLHKALIKGITEMGCDVIDIGYSTTPLFYYSVATLKADSGIIITASHNEGKFNGLKLTKKNAYPFRYSEISKIKQLIETKNFIISKKIKKGKIYYKNVIDKYVSKLLKYSKIKRKLKVVIDTGNGMGHLTVSKVFSKLNINTTYIFKEIDQTYPNHLANPLKTETLKDLQKKVLEKKADLGIAFDGDCDRVGFVDENGKIIPMDLITALLSKTILKKKPKSKILHDLRSSRIVKETIIKNNGIPIEYKVGHAFIKEKMHKDNIIFSGEVSGHYFYSDFFCCENSILTCLLVMNEINNYKLSEIIKPFRKYYKTKEINFKNKNCTKILKDLEHKYKTGKIKKTDGIKIDYKDWWFNLRLSNTENLLRLNLEANTKELMTQKLKEIKKIIVENN